MEIKSRPISVASNKEVLRCNRLQIVVQLIAGLIGTLPPYSHVASMLRSIDSVVSLRLTYATQEPKLLQQSLTLHGLAFVLQGSLYGLDF
jgi:hypothetical protein